MATIQSPVDVLIEYGKPLDGAIAHKRTAAGKPAVPNPNNPWDGTPTSAWPACMTKPARRVPDGQWYGLQGIFAQQHGAVPCPEPACFGGS